MPSRPAASSQAGRLTSRSASAARSDGSVRPATRRRTTAIAASIRAVASASSRSPPGGDRSRPPRWQILTSGSGNVVTPRPYRSMARATPGWLSGITHVPPNSTRTSVPGSAPVQVRPPSRSRASRMITRWPASRRSRAAVRPASPPPITRTSASCGPMAPKYQSRRPRVAASPIRATSLIRAPRSQRWPTGRRSRQRQVRRRVDPRTSRRLAALGFRSGFGFGVAPRVGVRRACAERSERPPSGR